jgi:hypothetical protein
VHCSTAGVMCRGLDGAVWQYVTACSGCSGLATCLRPFEIPIDVAQVLPTKAHTKQPPVQTGR